MEATMAREVDEKCNQEMAKITDPVEKFKFIAIKKRGLSGLKTIGKSFKIMDNDESGKLSKEEFRVGCEQWGMMFKSDDEFDAFCQNFDKDGSGSIDYEEFLAAIRPPMTECRCHLVKKAFDKISKTYKAPNVQQQQQEQQQQKQQQQKQQQQQKPASGSKKPLHPDDVITIEDLAVNYKVDQHPKYKNGEMTKEQVLKQFLDNFQPGDKLKDDQVTLEEFMDYYAAISLSVEHDAMFSFIMHSSWGVSPCEELH